MNLEEFLRRGQSAQRAVDEVITDHEREEQAHARERESVCETCGARMIDGRCTLCREGRDG